MSIKFTKRVSVDIWVHKTNRCLCKLSTEMRQFLNTNLSSPKPIIERKMEAWGAGISRTDQVLQIIAQPFDVTLCKQSPGLNKKSWAGKIMITILHSPFFILMNAVFLNCRNIWPLSLDFSCIYSLVY